MGDILSQNEIDDLLKALNTGEIDVTEYQNAKSEKKVKNHDFMRPSKFAKDHIKTLNIIHENYARLLTNFLTGYLRTLINVDVITVEALPYKDFSKSVPNPAIFGIVDLIPLNGSIIYEIAPQVAFALVDRILGGTGISVEKVREFTEIELAIIERVMVQMLNLLKDPWANVIQLKPRLERIETNAQFAQLISENEMVALVTLSAHIGDTEGMMNICIPHIAVEPIVSKLSTKFWYSMEEKEKNGESKQLIQSRIEKTAIPVKAILGRNTITVGEFLDLGIGDVLPLNTSINGDLEIMVGNLPKFTGTPGVKKNKVAVKINDVISREEDFYE